MDRSLDDPLSFISTNVMGTCVLLEQCRDWIGSTESADDFTLLHVSTDEVFGSVDAPAVVDESAPYRPSSPYSASKAAADHLVLAWHASYGLPVSVAHGTNCFGPRQFPEKLIPLMVRKAAAMEPLPVYGDGGHQRDWLHVDDMATGLLATLRHGRSGERYNLSTGARRTNLDVVKAICRELDARDGAPRGPRTALIEHTIDRPAHDRRYANDPSRAARELAWTPVVAFDDGLSRTVDWYLDNASWCDEVTADFYAGERLGLSTTRR